MTEKLFDSDEFKKLKVPEIPEERRQQANKVREEAWNRNMAKIVSKLEKQEHSPKSKKSLSGKRKTSEFLVGDIEAPRAEKKELDIHVAVQALIDNCHLVSVASKQLYAFDGRCYVDITDRTKAAGFMKQAFSEDTNRLTKDYNEILKQLLSEPSISYASLDDIERNRNVVVFLNGTYDVLTREFHRNQFSPDDIQNHHYTDDFVGHFTGHDPDREQLFYEIDGFTASDYENKKKCFLFLGKPNSGKRTTLRLMEVTVGSDLYIAVPIKHLSMRFVSGDFFRAKIISDEDVDLQTALNSRDISLIKKITSSDKIRTEAKFKNGEYIRPECKLVWASNGPLRFDTSEDLTPFFDRLIIFPLDESVPVEKRDPNIIHKLMSERNYITYRALNALSDLVEKNFVFNEVVDPRAYMSSGVFVNGVEEFVEEECCLDDSLQIGSTDLYNRYQFFCRNHPEYKMLSINPFTTYVMGKYGLERFRNSESRGLLGIGLNDAMTH